MSEVGAGGSRRLMHGRTGWCWIMRAGSLAFGVFLLQWIVKHELRWCRVNGGFRTEDVLTLCFLSVPVWLAFLGWWRHLALAISLAMVSVVLLGYALLWEYRWSGWSDEVATCTRLGLAFLFGFFLVLFARWAER